MKRFFNAGLLLAALLPAAGATQPVNTGAGPPEAEFHMARLIYTTGWGPGSRGPGRPWWAIDWPEAEYHFNRGLSRLTRIDAAPDSHHLRATDSELFDHPWLLVQQAGQWQVSAAEAKQLQAYLARGGFLLVDDFHGAEEWRVFERIMRRVLPAHRIVDIPVDDTVMQINYALNQSTQIPGHRHLRRGPGGETEVQMWGGPARWRGIYDDAGRLMVAINFNMDMGDAWEHADDPVYPEPMTALAYRFGINYVLYAMTH